MIFASFTVNMDIPVVDYYTWLLSKGKYRYKAKLEDGVYKIPPENDAQLFEIQKDDVDVSPRESYEVLAPEGCWPRVPIKKDGIKGAPEKQGTKHSRKKDSVASTHRDDRPLTFRPKEIYVPLPVSVPVDWKLINLEADLVRVNELSDQTKKFMFDTFAEVDFKLEVVLRKEKVLCLTAVGFEKLVKDMRFVELLYLRDIQKEHDKQEAMRKQLEGLRTEVRPIARRRDILNFYLKEHKHSKFVVSGFLELSPQFKNLAEAEEEGIRQKFAFEILSKSEAVLRSKLEEVYARNKEFFGINFAADMRILGIVIFFKEIYLTIIKEQAIVLFHEFLKTKDETMELRAYLYGLHLNISRMVRALREHMPVYVRRRGDYAEMLRRVGYAIVDSAVILPRIRAIVAERERIEAERRKRIKFLRGLFRIKIKSYDDEKIW